MKISTAILVLILLSQTFRFSDFYIHTKYIHTYVYIYIQYIFMYLRGIGILLYRLSHTYLMVMCTRTKGVSSIASITRGCLILLL